MRPNTPQRQPRQGGAEAVTVDDFVHLYRPSARATAHMSFALLLAIVRRDDDAEAHVLQALDLDPSTRDLLLKEEELVRLASRPTVYAALCNLPTTHEVSA